MEERRVDTEYVQDQLRLCYQWQSLMFTFSPHFPRLMLSSMVPTSTSVPSISLLSPLAVPVLVSWLLLASSNPLHLEDQTELANKLSKRLEVGLGILGEKELLACHAGLYSLSPGSEAPVRRALETRHGYRL